MKRPPFYQILSLNYYASLTITGLKILKKLKMIKQLIILTREIYYKEFKCIVLR